MSDRQDFWRGKYWDRQPSDIHDTAIISGDVRLGPAAQVGYFSIIRGNVTAGRNLRLGSHASIEGDVTIGDDVTIRGKCEIPNSIIGDRVNIYSGVKFYDTPNPPDGPNVPPVIEDDVTICCDSAILGGVTIGKGSFIGARCFVTEDVPPNSYVTCTHELKIRPRRFSGNFGDGTFSADPRSDHPDDA